MHLICFYFDLRTVCVCLMLLLGRRLPYKQHSWCAWQRAACTAALLTNMWCMHAALRLQGAPLTAPWQAECVQALRWL